MPWDGGIGIVDRLAFGGEGTIDAGIFGGVGKREVFAVGAAGGLTVAPRRVVEFFLDELTGQAQPTTNQAVFAAETWSFRRLKHSLHEPLPRRATTKLTSHCHSDPS